MTNWALDDDTTNRYRFMPALGVLVSALLHASVAVALLPALVPQQPPRPTEQPVPVTLELPMPPSAPSAVSAGPGPVHDLPTQTMAAAETMAPARDEAPGTAGTPTPTEPDVALILPPAEPPPPVNAREIGAGRSPPFVEANLEKILPSAEPPPLVSGREFAARTLPALAPMPNPQSRPQAPLQQQPVRQATPRRARQPQGTEGTEPTAGNTTSPVNRAALDDRHRQAQQDYLMQVVHKLSRARFQEQSREASSQGMVVARLTVARDGRLLDVSLARSSGFPGLDRSVAATIRNASPFPPLPAEFGHEPYTLVVPIRYALER